jgi:signal transduction histidine kinase
MFFNGLPLSSLSLEPAIERHFLTTESEVSVMSVLNLMSQSRRSCLLSAPNLASENTEKNTLTHQSITCVLVLAQGSLIGIFTQKDIVRLTARGVSLPNLILKDVISQPVIAIQEGEIGDVFAVLALFRQHHIHHLPIVNHSGQPVGIITQDSIRRSLQSINFLTRLRYVREVMTNEVIHALPSTSVLELAQLMADHKVSCIVICQHQTSSNHALIPIGIVTEYDIVQFQALELDLAHTKAATVMSYPLFCLHPEDSLWVAHQQMQEKLIRRIVITGVNQELLGLISQSSLLQVLNPSDLYGIIEMLQTAVEDRTSELENTNKKLRHEIQEKQRAEASLIKVHEHLKEQIAEQTSQLTATNKRLEKDIREREQVEQALRQSESELRDKAEQLQEALDTLQKTQLKLIQTEKMSSLGQLVSGIAHEINNPVNFIYGNLTYAEEYAKQMLDLLELYRKYYPNSVEEIQNKIEEIDLAFIKVDLLKLLGSMQSGADRIRDLVISLRNFSRLDESELKLVDIHEGLDNTLLILQNQMIIKGTHQGIQVVKKYGKIPKIECYPGQLNQVFMNIISNGIDAIQQSIIKQKETQNFAELSPEQTMINSEINLSKHQSYLPTIWITTEDIDSENEVIIRVADNGLGMSEEAKKQLFNPFFTTKPVGKGTGLGLSISYQIIVEKHGGKIDCNSEPGKGTEFIISIPKRQAKVMMWPL